MEAISMLDTFEHRRFLLIMVSSLVLEIISESTICELRLFMFYRNTDVTNELFCLAKQDLIQLYGNEHPLFLDDLGGK